MDNLVLPNDPKLDPPYFELVLQEHEREDAARMSLSKQVQDIVDQKNQLQHIAATLVMTLVNPRNKPFINDDLQHIGKVYYWQLCKLLPEFAASHHIDCEHSYLRHSHKCDWCGKLLESNSEVKHG